MTQDMNIKQINGLNQLARPMYPDGSAIINTMIQTSGAIGTAIAVSIFNASQHIFLSLVKNPATPANKAEALIAGTQDAFLFAAIVSIVGLGCSFLIKRVPVGQAKNSKSVDKYPIIKSAIK